MTTPMLSRLLLLLSLPMVSWSSRVTFDLVAEVGTPGPRTMSAIPAANGDWSSLSCDVATIRSGGGMKPPAAITHATTASQVDHDSGLTAIEIGHTPGLPDAVDEPLAYPAPKNGLLTYASNAYLIGTLDSLRHSGLSASAAAVDFNTGGRSKLLSVDGVTPYVVALAIGHNAPLARKLSGWENGSGMGSMNPNAPATKWLKLGPRHSDAAAMDVISWNMPMGEPLALCLIGLLGIMPSALRRRGEFGERRAPHRRRSSRSRILTSPERQSCDRADQK